MIPPWTFFASGGLGRVWKPLVLVPLRDGGETPTQRIQGKLTNVLGQVAGELLCGGGQYPAPANLEVLDGRPITASGVVPGRGLYITSQRIHAVVPALPGLLALM